MTPKKIKRTLGILLGAAIALADPAVIWGNETYRMIGSQNKCGLEVRVPQTTLDLGNLNPGDRKSSHIRVSNKGSKDINLYMRTNILEETTLNGGYLADRMDYTIKIKKEIISAGILRDVVDQGNLFIGILKPGRSKTIDLGTYLPGEETNNLYQGADMKVNWTFVSQCDSLEDKEESPSQGGGGSASGNPNPPELPPEIPELPNPPDLPDLPDPPEEIIIEEEKIPDGSLRMPKTGQAGSAYYYKIGSALVLAGVFLKKK